MKPAAGQFGRSRPAFATLLVAFAVVASACSGGSVGPPSSAASSVAPAGSDAAACDTSNLPGWPKPGQVTTSGVIPVLASSQRVAGASRLIFALIDDQNRPLGGPDVHLSVAFYDLCADAATPTQTVESLFAWGIEGQRGFYIANVTLGRAGTWGAAATMTDANGKQATARLQFDVADRGTTPALGDPAPSVKTPVLSDVGGDVRRISSDPNPNPAFYQVSVDQALARKTPFVLAFATPAFCKSAECGPTLDRIKQVVAQNPILVINVEPYELTYANGRLQPVLQNGSFVPVAATNSYGIPTEPWIFVIDASGKIAASFEAVVASDELAAAIRKVVSGG